MLKLLFIVEGKENPWKYRFFFFFFCRTFHYLHFCHLGKARAVSLIWWQLLFKNRRFHFSSRFCYDEEAQCRNIYFHFLYLTLEIGSILWSRWNKMWKKKKRSESFGVNCYILRKINIHVAQVWQLLIERHADCTKLGNIPHWTSKPLVAYRGDRNLLF